MSRFQRVIAVPSRRHAPFPLLLLALLAVLAVGGARANTASASNCGTGAFNCDYCSPYGPYWYGEACQYGNDFQGVAGTMQTHFLNFNASSEHVNSTIWIVNPNNGNPHWIEAGIGYGNSFDAQNYVLYWADQRSTCNCFDGHVLGNATADTAYDVKIKNEGNDTWSVDIGGYSKNSTDNPLTPYELRAGTEESTNYDAACSEQYNLAYWDSNGVEQDGWGDPNHPNAALEYDAPPYAWWVKENYWVRDRSNYPTCYGVTAGTTTPTATIGTTTTSPSADTNPALTADKIKQIEVNFAALMGDPSPTSIERVQSSRQQAVSALTGDEVPSSSDVYAIVMHGQFVATNSPIPYDGPAPSGSVLTLVIDATTGQLTDFGIQNQAPDLTSLGPVTQDQ